MDSKRLAIQIRDVEILYDALAKYYWKGSVDVYTSFTTLPRGRFVPDSNRIILKEESYDVMEHGGQRYPLRLLVKSPELSSLQAQNSRYPDTQATFFVRPDMADTACVLLFYVFTSEQDRKLCCPYSVGSSVLLMTTELSQVLEQEDRTASRQMIIRELFHCLPMHSTGFRKLDQSQLHGFLIMKESKHPQDPEKYWNTTGLQSTVQLTMNVSLATCFRISSACDNNPSVEERSIDSLERRCASATAQDFKDISTLVQRESQPRINLNPKPEVALQGVRSSYTQYSPITSLPNHPYPSANAPSYNVFDQDSARIWSALNRYSLGLGRGNFRIYSISSTPLSYYPPWKDATTQELQVPLEDRRSFKVRAHYEREEGFPNYLFVNQDTMTLTSNKTSSLFQAIYLLEFAETSQVAILCYAFNSASGRQLVLPSYQEETKNQLNISVSGNLAPLLDGEDKEQAIQQLVDKVFPHLLPCQGLDNSLFQMEGPHDHFLLLKATPHKYYYWTIKSGTNAVNMTINSTEAAIFQLNISSS